MKKILYIAALALGFIAVSCENTFSLDGQVGPGALLVHFSPSNVCDSTFFYVTETTPLSDYMHPRYIKNEKISVTVGGEQIALEKLPYTKKQGGALYCTTHKFHPGDEIKVTAIADGIRKEAHSEFVYPSPLEDYEITTSSFGKDHERRTSFEISYRKSSSGEYYAMGVISHTRRVYHWGSAAIGEEIVWDEPVVEDYTDPVSLYGEVDNALSSVGADPLTIDPAYVNNIYKSRTDGDIFRSLEVMPWTDENQKEGEMVKAKVNCYLDEGGYYVWEYDDEGIHHIHESETTREYKLVLVSISEGLYKYLKAHENMRNNAFTELGLAPASFTYSNIVNGYGVAGAYILSESDWFTIDEQ